MAKIITTVFQKLDKKLYGGIWTIRQVGTYSYLPKQCPVRLFLYISYFQYSFVNWIYFVESQKNNLYPLLGLKERLAPNKRYRVLCKTERSE